MFWLLKTPLPILNFPAYPAPYLVGMSDFNEVKEQVGELLLYMVDYIDECKLPLMPVTSLEVERSRTGGIVQFPGLEIKSQGLRCRTPKKQWQLKKELHELVSPLSTSPKDIGLPSIFGAKITVKRDGNISGYLIFGGELTDDQQEIKDSLLEDWNRADSDLDCPASCIDQINGSEDIVQKSNELLDCLLDIARSRKQRFKESAYAGAKQMETPKGEHPVMLYGWNIRTGKDSKSEALRIKVEAKMKALSKALTDAGLPELRYADIQFWPRTNQISLEMSFPPEAGNEQEAVLQNLKRCWFKHLNSLHETDGKYCPGCGKTKCRN